jgi:D-alanine-D-alanine ligase
VDFVKCADDIFLRKGESTEGLAQKAVEKLGLPMFVKPTDGGSSFGVTKVKSVEDFDKAVEYAFSEGNMLIAEAAIVGRELTCAVYYNGKENVALPVIEILTENEFFDYEAKYTASKVEEITPARIADEVAAEISATTSKIYDIIGARGIIRVDYIIIEGEPYLLEVNTTPGMTETSFIPQQIRATGVEPGVVLTEIIEDILQTK